MAEVVPTTGPALDGADYAVRLKKLESFTQRLHIDIGDGVFSPVKTIGLAQVYGLQDTKSDLHLMLVRPQDQLETVISLSPSLVIIHAESQANHENFFSELRPFGIQCGLALLPETAVTDVASLIPGLDHLLIFTGTLGHDAGEFHANCLAKITEAKKINPDLEVGVDGGIDLNTAQLASKAGADVINSGSFIRDAQRPKLAYQELQQAVK